MERPEVVDDDVLRLRTGGRPYARISRELGLARSSDAQKAFQRAFRRLSTDERADVRRAELLRLDRLEVKVRAAPSTSADELDRRLKSIRRLRALVVEP